MKLKVKIHLDARQGVLLGLTLLVLLAAAGAEYVLLPQYDRWVSLREVSQTQAAKYARLTRSLAAGKAVNAAFEKLGQAPRQSDSDEITLSSFLRDLERLARYPNMTVVNMSPLPVRDLGAVKKYGVQMSVSDSLQHILQFVSDATTGSLHTGVESFTLRGVQGSGNVECAVSLYTLCLADGGTPRGKTAASARSKTGGQHD